MPFIAVFDDGPMEGTRLDFVGHDSPFADLYAMPHPADADAPWLIVGYTGLEPEQPWQQQVHYQFARLAFADAPESVAQLAQAGVEQTIAHYRVADPEAVRT